ncbi:YibE/F family protein [Natronospora cellulosivora (SeqCode)]
MNRNRLYLLVFLILFLLSSSFFYSTNLAAMEAGEDEGVEDYYRAQVLTVEDIEHDNDFVELEQVARVVLISGPLEGDIVDINNLYISSSNYANVYLEEGTELVIAAYRQDGQINYFLQDIVRDRGLLYLTIIFIVLILLVGLLQGLKTLITLALSAIVIFQGMLPLLLAGYSPIPVASMAAILIIVVILVIIGGFNSKSFAAIVGTSVGVLIAGLLAYYIGNISHLTGLSSSEAQMLLTGDLPIDIRGLLFAGIIIGSLGAITDVGMSVASTAEQIKKANPDMGFRELTIASFNVGRDIMGTMANTLILAYVGGSIHLLLLIQRYEVNWLRIINMDMIATEIVRGLAGSIGLIISIPITALVSGYFISKKKISLSERV